MVAFFPSSCSAVDQDFPLGWAKGCPSCEGVHSPCVCLANCRASGLGSRAVGEDEAFSLPHGTLALQQTRVEERLACWQFLS